MKNELNLTMNQSVPWVDRLAISVSFLCLAHCLLVPILLVTLPSLSTSFLAGESLHLWLVYMVIPSSLFALGMGCKQHNRSAFLIMGVCGLSLLILGASVELIGIEHVWEKIFTVSGALLIAFAHVRNFQLCQQSAECACG